MYAPRSVKDSPEVSIVSTAGNTRSSTISLRNLFVYEEGRFKIGLAAGGLGAHSGGSVTAERYYADEKPEWKLTPETYLFQKGGWGKDRFAGIRARYESSAGFGRHFIEAKNDLLDAELGAGYIWERRTEGPPDNFPMMRGFGKYLHHFSTNNVFSQDAEWFFNVEQINDFRVKTNSAIISVLTGHVSLKTSFSWSHVNRPPLGTVPDDTTTSVALVGSF